MIICGQRKAQAAEGHRTHSSLPKNTHSSAKVLLHSHAEAHFSPGVQLWETRVSKQVYVPLEIVNAL